MPGGAAQLVDGMLSSILAKHGDKLGHLPRAQQGFVASVVAQSKDRLTAKLEAKLEEKRAAGKPPVVTKDDMDALLADVGEELAAIKASAASELSMSVSS